MTKRGRTALHIAAMQIWSKYPSTESESKKPHTRHKMYSWSERQIPLLMNTQKSLQLTRSKQNLSFESPKNFSNKRPTSANARLNYSKKIDDPTNTDLFMLEVLLENGLLVDARDENQFTPLLIASSKGRTAVVYKLLCHSADIYAKDSLSRNALHHACFRGYVSLIRMLVKLDVDRDVLINHVDSMGKKPSDLIKVSKLKCCHYIIEIFTLSPPLVFFFYCFIFLILVESPVHSFILFLSSLTFSLIIKDRNLRVEVDTIWGAVKKGDYESVVRLAQRGNKVKYCLPWTIPTMHERSSLRGRTPLIFCVIFAGVCRRKIVKEESKHHLYPPLRPIKSRSEQELEPWNRIASFLLRSGASVDAADVDACTALMYAARDGLAEKNGILHILLEHGADPNLQDVDGNTALHYASAFQQPSAMAALMKARANPEIENINGEKYAAVAGYRNKVGIKHARNQSFQLGVTEDLRSTLEFDQETKEPVTLVQVAEQLLKEDTQSPESKLVQIAKEMSTGIPMNAGPSEENEGNTLPESKGKGKSSLKPLKHKKSQGLKDVARTEISPVLRRSDRKFAIDKEGGFDDFRELQEKSKLALFVDSEHRELTPLSPTLKSPLATKKFLSKEI